MSRFYSVPFEGITVSAAQDFFEIRSSATSVTRIHRVSITNETSETSEQLVVAIKRGEGSVTSGSGGASVTPVPLSKGDPAFGGTCERNNTTKLVVGSGAIKVLHREGFNVVGSGLDWSPAKGECDISPSDYFVVELITAPAAGIPMSGSVEIEEIGG